MCIHFRNYLNSSKIKRHRSVIDSKYTVSRFNFLTRITGKIGLYKATGLFVITFLFGSSVTCVIKNGGAFSFQFLMLNSWYL